MPGVIDTHIEHGVLSLRMNRPSKKNALTDAMYHALADAMEAAETDDAVRAVVLMGAGGDFTTGNDIADFLAAATGQRGPDAGKGVGRFLKAQIEITLPFIAAVDGLAVGVGATTLFQCDLVYASDRADIRTPFVDLGVVSENASSLLAPRIMGHQRAFQMLCLGDKFSGQEAYDAGLVAKVCAADEVEAVAMDAARRLAAKPPGALKMTRDLLRGDLDAIRERSALENKIFAERLQSDEARAAFSAFMTRKSG